MSNERKVSIFLIIILFAFGTGMGILKKDVLKFPSLPACTEQETTNLEKQAIKTDPLLGPVTISEHRLGSTNYSEKKIYVDADFKSNLPIVIIDTGDKKPVSEVVWDPELKCNVPTGRDPYVTGTMNIIEGEYNQVTDKPSLTTNIKIKIRGNSSNTYDKKQYRIKTLGKKGNPSKKDVLGMGRDSDWILNISFADKSLLRNFMAFSTAKVLNEETPDTRYCEVLWKENGKYRYDGVYLMMESISVGEKRVDLPRFSENTEIVPALYRRDRYTPNDLMLDNYSYLNNKAMGRIGVIYPDKELISDSTKAKLTEQVNRLEEALYSDDLETFYKYRDYVDMDSFVDYFIINEFYLNYDAGYFSTYFYTTYDGRIHIGPVWDFDQGIDNSGQRAKLCTTAFHSAPWFDRMLRDPIFTEKIEERYHMLRETLLSDASIDQYIESVKQYLGPAAERDWDRWGYYYKINPDSLGNEKTLTQTWEEETERVQRTLKTHAHWLDYHIDSLYQFKAISLEDAKVFTHEIDRGSPIGPLLAVVFVIVFFVSVILVLRKESE